MEEWKEYKLGEVASLSTGFPFKGEKYSKEGVRVVRGDNITIGELRWPSEKDKRWNEPFDRSEEFSLHDSDIVIGMDGSRVGYNRAQIKKEDLPLLIAQRVACIRNNEKSLQSFLYYQIFSNRFLSYIRNIQTGSAIPHVSLKQIGDFTISLPPLDIQCHIASILSSLDDKIAVNKKICKNLEAQAQALFKHWFVDFAPFKDGKFVESELGLIPEGWRVGKFGEVAELRKPSIKPQDNILYTHYSIPTFDNNKMPSMDEGSTIKSNKFGISDGAVLLSKLNPSTKRIWYTGNVPKDSVSSTEFLPFYSKNNKFTPFIYCYLNCDINYREIANGAKGTTNSHQRIDANSIMTRGLAYSEEAIRKFCDCCQNFMEMILEANQESLRLSTLRDTLLPKLMSGEIKVNEIAL